VVEGDEDLGGEAVDVVEGDEDLGDAAVDVVEGGAVDVVLRDETSIRS
jgi:hypothetical protein